MGLLGTTTPRRLPSKNTTDDEGGISLSSADDDTQQQHHDKRHSSIHLAKKETQAYNQSRIFMLLVLFCVAIGSSISVHYVTKSSETQVFEETFQDQASKIVESFEQSATRRVGALQAFSQTITSWAVHSDSHFPNVTLPDFERQAQNALFLSDTVGLGVISVVQTEERSGYEAYVNEHQGWLNEGMKVQEEQVYNNIEDDRDTLQYLADQFDKGNVTTEQTNIDAEELFITPVIYRVEEGGTAGAPETGPGPYMPIWQFAPAIPAHRLVNFNALRLPSRAKELTAFLDETRTKQVLMSKAVDVKNEDPDTANGKSILELFLNRWRNGTYEYENGPVSDIYLPIYDNNGPSRRMKSILTAYVYWQSYFTNVLPEDAKGIIATLYNTCNQTYSYEINGKDVTYLGPGERHSAEYEYLMVETGLGAIVGEDNVPVDVNTEQASSGSCYYKVAVYPTEVTEEQFTTMTPAIFAGALAAVFLFTSLVFLMFDRIVAKRHQVINTTAVQSTAVVQSLFPETVRDRLFQSTSGAKSKSKAYPTGNGGIHNPSPSTQPRHSATSSEFLAASMEQTAYDDDYSSSDPIADLYPDSTVLFADIAGFTKWSSSRPPTDVFRLLEALYGEFDKIATQRKVFKVETIGDCYVAVTGLPVAQPDHAVRMCRFAADCRVAMNEVKHRLAARSRLGPDVAQLSMRCGIHSGPVTAGILRGDRARFQLFGDTVNTAARMESTGETGNIQVSSATARLLQMAGKEAWLTERPDVVTPKGKEAMRTYWCTPPKSVSLSSSSRRQNQEGNQQNEANSITISSTSKRIDVSGRVVVETKSGTTMNSDQEEEE